jgi:hypothetical protein
MSKIIRPFFYFRLDKTQSVGYFINNAKSFYCLKILLDEGSMPKPKYRFEWLLGLIIVLGFQTSASSADLAFSLPDTAIYESVQTKSISLYFSNFADTIAGVRFQVETSPPGIIYFAFSETAFDTSGTLASGWELINAFSSDGDNQDIVFYGLANWITPPQVAPPLPPQSGGKLIKLKFRMFPLPDSVTFVKVDLLFNNDIFSMADPEGNSLGILIDTIVTCLEYEGDSCILADTTIESRLDTSKVDVKNGSIIIINGLCGDMNLDGNRNLLDISCLIGWLYVNKNNPLCPAAPCDFNQDGKINLLDISYLIKYLYQGGPPPP